MNRPILTHCIKGKPGFKLKGSLAHYDNARLIALAEKQHLIVNMGGPIDLETLNRKELLESLHTQIHSHFEKDLFYLPPREIEFISKLINVDLKVEEDIDYEECKFLHGLGYVHLYDYKDKVYPIIPKELRVVYKAIPKDKLVEKTKLNNELYAYAIALTQIHGIYSIEHFMAVWNRYNEDKIDLEDALMYLDTMYDRQDYFNFDYKYVVTNYPSNDEGYKLLEGPWSDDWSFRMPDKAEIEMYSGGSLGKNSPYYERLARLI